MKKYLIYGLLVCFIGLFAFKYLSSLFNSKLLNTNNNEDQVKEISKNTLEYLDVYTLLQKTPIQDSVYAENTNKPVPTNKWFSSVLFTKGSEPIFAYPLAVKFNDDGFGLSYPRVVSTADTIFGSYVPDVKFVFQNTQLTSSLVSSDDLSINVVQKNGNNPIVNTQITHGSPYVYVSLVTDQLFKVISQDFNLIQQDNESVLFMSNGRYYAMFFSQNDFSISNQDNALSIQPHAQNTYLSFAVLPNAESQDVFKEYAFNPIVSSDVSFNSHENIMSTHFALNTQQQGDTLFAILPHNMEVLQNNNAKTYGTYQTIYGEMTLLKGTDFYTERTMAELPLSLNIDILSDSQKDTLRVLVRNDVNNKTITEEDTYFLGKKLFALANILDIAEQLKMDHEILVLKSELKTELETWRLNTESQSATKKYFYYDPKIKGVVGEKASFGSEVFNDHHFHYGYFIYAASILARYDNQYLNDNRLFINTLVQDIANTNREDKNFPYLRVFDTYLGHSFASGQGLFADGNNQESSSEAINAWYAVYLWSKVTSNVQLEKTALYLYTEESSSALENWLNINKNDERFANYKHNFVSMVWGGKMDFATWFSARPEAKLGIQIIPVNPASIYLGKYKDMIQQNLNSEKELQQPTMFKDYIVLYKALYDPDAALVESHILQKDDIDGANSRSFIEAWIMLCKNNISDKKR